MFRNSCEFSENFYDLEGEDLMRTIAVNGAFTMVSVEFSYKQLQRGDAYFEEGASALGWNWLKIRRELLNQWVNSTNESPFHPDDLHDLVMNKIEPIGELQINKFYSMKIYREYRNSDKVIIAVDPSKGIGKDSTAVVVIDSITEEIIGIFKSSKMSYPQLQRFLETLISEQFPNAMLVIENNIGRSIISYLLETPFKHHVYGEFKDMENEIKYNDGSVQKQKTRTLVHGINTNTKTRPIMYDMLLNYVTTKKELLKPDALVSEISTLQYRNNTKIEAATNKHDDVVMAYLVGIYALYHGTNLLKYGIMQKGMYETSEVNVNSVKNMRESIASKRAMDQMGNTNPFVAEMLHNMRSKTFDQAEKERLKKRYIESLDQNDKMQYYSNTSGSNIGLATANNNLISNLNKAKRSTRNKKSMGGFLNSLDI